MNSIRLRLLFLLLTGFSLIISFSYITVSSYIQYIDLNKEILSSSDIKDLTKELPRKSVKDSLLHKLKDLRSDLHPRERMLAMSDVIQSYADRNPSLLKKRIQRFIKIQSQYTENLRKETQWLDKRIQIYGIASVGSMFILLVLIYLYIQFSIFTPIRGLFKKMIEFLNNRYTYQFTLPNPNEIGKLHTTFNAMAQRVLSNFEELKSLDAARSDFLSIVSHELRTPLTSIKGSLSLLKSGVVKEINLNKPTTNLLSIAETETDRLIRLVNEILDLAKIEARKFLLEKDWHPLKDIIRQTFEAISGLSNTANISLVCEELPDVDLYIDSSRIQQVLTNLLSNAIKYSSPQSPVRVFCHIRQERLVIEVRDQGPGIAPTDQSLIFEKFRQTTGPNNPLVKGTGLGLSIAKAIVEEHGGYIGLKSVVGEGSTFYFILPQWRAHIIQDKNPNLGLSKKGGEGIKLSIDKPIYSLKKSVGEKMVEIEKNKSEKTDKKIYPEAL